MKTYCPHCRKQLEAPEAQADLQCPFCQRYFLWIPSADGDETSESSPTEEDSEKIEQKEHMNKSEPPEYQTTESRQTGGASNNSDKKVNIGDNYDGSLYSSAAGPTPVSPARGKGGTHMEQTGAYERVSLYGNSYLTGDSAVGQNGEGEKKRNMYPYELPGQTMEADRRMPVYTSMMADAYRVFEGNVSAVVVSMIVFSLLFLVGTLVYASFLTLVWRLVVDMTFAPGAGIYALVVAVSAVYAVYVVWIFNGQCRYYVELLRYGKTSAQIMFSGFPGLIRTCIVWLIMGTPLLIPIAVASYFTIGYMGDSGYLNETDVQKIHQILGPYYPAQTATRLTVGVSAAVVGIIVFLLLKLYLGISYWLILDKDLDLVEALTVSVKITKEKKGTFLAIIMSCLFGWLALTILTFGMGATLFFPIILLFIAMYYMKTAIQEMVIPGKSAGTIENPHIGLYDYGQNNYNKKVESKDSDEVDIL